MNNNLRRSVPAKMAAIGFIALILIGNFWGALALIGGHVPDWLKGLAFGAIVLTIVAGIGLVALAVLQRLRPEANVDGDLTSGQ